MKTNDGFKIMLNRTYKSTPDYTVPSKFKVGINQTSTDINDTDLVKPVPIYNTTLIDNCENVSNWSAGTDGSVSLNSVTYKEGNGAMNLTKTGTTIDNVLFENSSMNTSDFTDKDLWVWLYIDSTELPKISSIKLRYGTDSSNYYEKEFTSLGNGWNSLTMNTTDSTETGTVTLTSISYGAILITYNATTDTTIEGNIITDYWKLADSNSYIDDATVTIDESNKEVSIVCELNSVKAVGYLISGLADYNIDSTRKIDSIFNFTGISKSDTDELKFTIKSRLRSE